MMCDGEDSCVPSHWNGCSEDLHSQVSEVLKLMLSESDADLIAESVG